MQEENGISFFGALWDGLIWLVQNIAGAFYNFGYAVTHPQLWLDWSDKASIMRFVYYGGSVEFFFVVFTAFLVLTAIGIYYRGFMWGMVRGLEGFANTTGRFFAWAGLLMVLQQIIIVFMQRVFARPDMSFGFGIPFTNGHQLVRRRTEALQRDGGLPLCDLHLCAGRPCAR